MARTHKRSFVKRDQAQTRAYSPAVITEGGRIVWLAGQTGGEDASGRSLAEFIAERITGPLRMADTGFAATGERAAR